MYFAFLSYFLLVKKKKKKTIRTRIPYIFVWLTFMKNIPPVHFQWTLIFNERTFATLTKTVNTVCIAKSSVLNTRLAFL